MFTAVYLPPPPPPLPARDRRLAGVLIGEAVLGPLAIIGLAVAGSGFGPGAGPGSWGFKAAGVAFALFFLSISAVPIVLRDLAGRAAPASMRPLSALTVITLGALSLAVGVIFATAGVQTPPALPLAFGLFTAAAGLLTVLNGHMVKVRRTSMAVAALGVVFGALSLAGGLLITVMTASNPQGGNFGASLVAFLLIVLGFICYLVYAVALGIVVLRRGVLPAGADPF